MQKTLSQPINKTHFILLQHIQLQEKKQPNNQNHPKKKNLKPKFNIYNPTKKTQTHYSKPSNKFQTAWAGPWGTLRPLPRVPNKK